jgi:hypothetical protein
MDVITQPQGLRVFSVASIGFGILGGIFYWWVPLGMIASMAGLLMGFVEVVSARRHSLTYSLSIAGVLVSAATLALNITIAVMGLQTWTLGGGP